MSFAKKSTAFTRPKNVNSSPHKEEYLNSSLNHSQQDSIFLNTMRSLAKQNDSPSPSARERNNTSRSPRPKTFREIRNISPMRSNGQKSAQKNNDTYREKIEQNMSIMENKDITKTNDFKHILKKIFGFYAAFGGRISSGNLKANNLFKLIHDAALLDKTTITQTNLDILFRRYSLRKNTIDFDKFLLLILDIANLKFPDLKQKDSFVALFSDYLKPLYCDLYRETEVGKNEMMLQTPLDLETIAIIEEIKPALAKVHRTLFASEYLNIESKAAKSKAELTLPSFLKDYSLCPFMINLNNGHSLFQEIIDIKKSQLAKSFASSNELAKDQGIAFTLNRFILYLTRIAINNFAQPSSDAQDEDFTTDISQPRQFILLLEKMEVSQGFDNFKKSASTLLPANLTLLPRSGYQSYIADFDNYDEKSPRRSTTEDYMNSKGHYTTYQSTFRSQTANQRDTSPNGLATQLLSTTIAVFEQYMQMLQDIYKSYCPCSGTKNDTLHLTGLINIFRDANLLNATNESVYRKSSRSPNRKDLDSSQMTTIIKTKLLNQTDLEILVKEILVKRNSTTSRFRSGRNIDPYIEQEDEENKNLQKSPRKQAGLTFEAFLVILEQVSLKTYSDLDEDSAIRYVIDQHLSEILKKEKFTVSEIDLKQQLAQLMQMLRDPVVMDVLTKMKKRMQSCFKEYFIPKRPEINFNGFINFCRDFAIFPQIISRIKLTKIFFNLAALYPLLRSKGQSSPQDDTHRTLTNGQNNEARENQRDILDENLFVESIAVCALELNSNGSEDIIDKMSSLFIRMNENMNPKKRETQFKEIGLLEGQKALQDVSVYIKTKYGDRLQDNKAETSKRIQKFEDIFD